MDHYLRSLRGDPDVSNLDIKEEDDMIDSKDLRSSGAMSDHMFRSRRSVDDSNKRSENGEMYQQSEKAKPANPMHAYWDQSLRTVRF